MLKGILKYTIREKNCGNKIVLKLKDNYFWKYNRLKSYTYTNILNGSILVNQKQTGNCKMEVSSSLYLAIRYGTFSSLLLGYGSLGCLEEEKVGLFKLKAPINHPNGTSLSS